MQPCSDGENTLQWAYEVFHTWPSVVAFKFLNIRPSDHLEQRLLDGHFFDPFFLKVQKTVFYTWIKLHRIRYHPTRMIICERETVPGDTRSGCLNRTEICVNEVKRPEVRELDRRCGTCDWWASPKSQGVCFDSNDAVRVDKNVDTRLWAFSARSFSLKCERPSWQSLGDIKLAALTVFDCFLSSITKRKPSREPGGISHLLFANYSIHFQK